MADVLKSLPFLTMEDYKWKYSNAYIRFMAADASRVEYRNKPASSGNVKTVSSPEEFVSAIMGNN